MEYYRYIAHNSVLWLWSLMGLVGVTLLWMFIPVSVFFALRCYSRATTMPFRVASLCTVAIAIMYFLQAFGDMGIMSWSVNALLACGIALTGGMTRQLGVWPDRNA